MVADQTIRVTSIATIADSVIHGIQRGSIESTESNFMNYLEKLVQGKITQNHSEQREMQLRDAEFLVLHTL
jgi:hypothetical protein